MKRIIQFFSTIVKNEKAMTNLDKKMVAIKEAEKELQKSFAENKKSIENRMVEKQKPYKTTDDLPIEKYPDVEDEREHSKKYKWLKMIYDKKIHIHFSHVCRRYLNFII